MRKVYAYAMHPVSNVVRWKTQPVGDLSGARWYRNFIAAEPNPDVRAKLLD